MNFAILAAGRTRGGVSTGLLNDSRIIADGNSYLVVASGAIMARLSEMLSSYSGVNYLNYGVGGQSTSLMLADQESQILPQFQAGKKNFLIVIEGGNDIASGLTAAQAYNNYKSYGLAAIAAGFKVIVSTTIPRNEAPAGRTQIGYNTALSDFNALVVSDSSFYDGIIRPDLSNAFATFAAAGYDTDGIHPSAVVGCVEFARLLKNELLRIAAI